jgi:hypothetical protein
MNRRDVLTALTMLALLPTGGNAAPRPGQPLKETDVASVDLRDAPVDVALEMLLGAYGFKVEVTKGLWGTVSLKTSELPLPHNLELIRKDAAFLSELQIADGVYRFSVTEEQEARTWRDRFDEAIRQYVIAVEPKSYSQTGQDTFRRVSGVMGVQGGPNDTARYIAAILETRKPDTTPQPQIVRVGDRVTADSPGASDLRVAAISHRGVTLEAETGDTRFMIPLYGAGRLYPHPDFRSRRSKEAQPRNRPESARRPMEPIILRTPITRPTQGVKPVSGMRMTPKAKVKPSGG